MNKPIVETICGSLQGAQSFDLDGEIFYKFLGIPYAKPPIRNLRFKEPQPTSAWIGIRNATRESNPCYQFDEETRTFLGSEDCLYLNVFTRKLPSSSDASNNNTLKPVMVFIHGGNFKTGSNSTKYYGPEFLMIQDIVLVTINYRLGFLGFLRFKDPTLNISGNMGFKDQVEALRWVKSNIEKFNGDPENITLFGISVGAASVHYHILSPLSKGLFHKAILQSGSALTHWGDETDHTAVQLAKFYDSNITTEKEAFNLLTKLDVQELYSLQIQYLKNPNHFAMSKIGLVIEPSNKRNAFITKRPIEIITSGDYNKVPMIIGYADQEGQFINVVGKFYGLKKKFVLENLIPHNVNLKSDKELRQSFIYKMEELYRSEPSLDENSKSLMLGDFWFVIGAIASVKNHSQTSPYPIYLYKFSLDSKLNLTKKFLNLTDSFEGATHADDQGYFFKSYSTPLIEPGSMEDRNLRQILRLWINFSKTGNPTPNQEEFGIIWKPAMSRHLNTFHISNNEWKNEVNPEERRIEFWREIYRIGTYTNKYL